MSIKVTRPRNREHYEELREQYFEFALDVDNTLGLSQEQTDFPDYKQFEDPRLWVAGRVPVYVSTDIMVERYSWPFQLAHSEALEVKRRISDI